MHLYYITTPDGTASVVARNLHEAYALAYATYSDVLTVTWTRRLTSQPMHPHRFFFYESRLRITISKDMPPHVRNRLRYIIT